MNTNLKEAGLISILFLVLGISYFISGVSVVNFLIVLVTYVGFIYLPGLFIYKILNVDFFNHIKYNKIIVSNVLGLAILFLVDFLSIKIGNKIPLFIIPIMLAFANVILNNRNRTSPKIDIALLAVLIFIMTVYSFFIIGYPNLEKVGIYNYLSIDKFWHAGNSYAFDYSFLPPNLHVNGMTFKYHFFDDWLIGILYKITNIPTFDISFYYIIPIYLGILCISLFSVGDYFLKEKKYVILFLLSTLFITSISSSLSGNFFHIHIFRNPNAVLPASSLLIMVSIMIIEILKTKKVTIKNTLLIGVTFFLLAGFKSVFAILIPIVILFVCLIKAVLEKKNQNHLVALIMLTMVVYVVFHMIFLGFESISTVKVFSIDTIRENGAMKKMLNVLSSDTNIVATLLLIPVYFIFFIPFQSILLLIGLFGFIRRIDKASSSELFIYGMAFSGIVLIFMLYHEGNSHFYFIYASMFFINLLAVSTFKRLYETNSNNKFYTMLTLGLLLTGGVLMIKQLYSDVRTNYTYAYKTNYTIDQEGVVTLEERQALEWLKNNSNKEDIFVTNRHALSLNDDGKLGDKKGRFFYYTAFSGRQAFIEGYFYTHRIQEKTHDTKKQYFVFKDEVYQNMKTNNSIFDGENIETHLKKNNIRFIVNNKLVEKNLNDVDKEYLFLDKVFENEIIEIYKYVHLDKKF